MKHFQAISLLLLLSTSLIWSADILTIEDAFESAKENNISYSLSLRQYQDSVELNSSFTSLIPSISLNGQLGTEFDNDFSYQGITGEIGISADFSLTPSTYTEKKSQRIENESEYLSLLSTEEQLLLSVAESYLNIILYKEACSVSASTLETAQRQYDNIMLAYEAGTEDELEVLNASETLASAKSSHKANENQLATAMINFKTLTGIEDTSNLMTLEDIEYVDLPEAKLLLEKYGSNITALLASKNEIASAELNKSETLNTMFIPTISLSASYGLNGNLKTDFTGSDSMGLSVQVAASIPLDSLIPGSSKNNQLKAADNSISYANTSYQIAYENLYNELENTVTSISFLETEIEDGIAFAANAEKKLKATIDAYENGLVSFDSLDSAMSNLTSSQYSLISDRASYILKLYNLANMLSTTYEELISSYSNNEV